MRRGNRGCLELELELINMSGKIGWLAIGALWVAAIGYAIIAFA